MNPSLLKIQGAGMPPILLEECTQVLEDLPLGGLHRTVNGELLYTGPSGPVKYRTVCSGKGKMTPAFETLKRGDQITLQCIQRLWQEAQGPDITLSRPAVENTLFVMNDKRELLPFTMVSSTQLVLQEKQEKMVYVSYCPLLKGRITQLHLTTEEWGEKSAWQLEVEEI